MTSRIEPDDFDVAKAIVAQVKELPPERRERIFRWVAESIGLSAVAPHSPSNPASQGAAGGRHPANETLQPPAGVATNIKTFIASKAPKGDAQFAAAVAYFHRFEAPQAQRQETINATLLQEATRLAGRARFSNPLSTLNNAKRSGFLDSNSRGEFTINSVGENLVAMTLPGEGASNAIVNANSRPRKKKKSGRS